MNNKKINDAIKVFNGGGVVIFPTDTAYGIGCRMDDENAVKKVFSIKERALGNAVLVLVDSIEMANKYVFIPEQVKEKLIDKYWPGGLSIFFKTRPGMVSDIVTAGTDILAIRWPKHKVMQQIIHEVGVPIVATSANKSGSKTPYSLDDLSTHIAESVDLVLDGECTYKKESTIINSTRTPWEIVRQGVVSVNIHK